MHTRKVSKLPCFFFLLMGGWVVTHLAVYGTRLYINIVHVSIFESIYDRYIL